MPSIIRGNVAVAVLEKGRAAPPAPPPPKPVLVTRRAPQSQRSWQSWEIDLMNRFYREKGPVALAGKLGRTMHSVKGKARSLGLMD